MKYKNAFNCKRCPERNDAQGCPVWWEDVWESEERPGDVQVLKACGFTLIPRYLKWSAGRSALAAGVVQQLRNEQASPIREFTLAISAFTSKMEQLPLQLPFDDSEAITQERDNAERN